MKNIERQSLFTEWEKKNIRWLGHFTREVGHLSSCSNLDDSYIREQFQYEIINFLERKKKQLKRLVNVDGI